MSALTSRRQLAMKSIEIRLRIDGTWRVFIPWFDPMLEEIDRDPIAALVRLSRRLQELPVDR